MINRLILAKRNVHAGVSVYGVRRHLKIGRLIETRSELMALFGASENANTGPFLNRRVLGAM